MNTREMYVIGIALLGICTTIAYPAAAGGKKDVAKAAIARVLERDAARDAATKARPLGESRTIWRYTTEAQALQEARQGIEAGRHFTSNVTPGRPPRAATARQQYGLPRDPDVRMTVRIEEGAAVRQNKAMGGQRGRAEITNAELLPAQSIRSVSRLPNRN